MTVQMIFDELGTSGGGAVFSDCMTYRYQLTRWWGTGPWVTWVMLNPSTADAQLNDPTITRCINHSKRWGYGGLTVVNLYAYRSPKRKDLLAQDDPVGPENDYWIRKALEESREVVAAWGDHKMARKRSPLIRTLAGELERPLVCLKLTWSGAPWHPLYTKNDAERIPWPPA